MAKYPLARFSNRLGEETMARRGAATATGVGGGAAGPDDVSQFLQMVTPDYASYQEKTKQVFNLCMTAAIDAALVEDKGTIDKLDEQVRSLLVKDYICGNQKKNIEVLRSSGLPKPEDLEKVLTELENVQYTDGDFTRNAQYKEFRESIWKVNHPSEAMAWGDDGMDEDDIVVGAQVESFICPLTQKPFERPMKNKNCRHHYSEAAINQYIRTATKRPIMCPHSGCTQAVDIKSLEYNKVLDRQMKAQQITIATQASQHQPDVDIDDLSED